MMRTSAVIVLLLGGYGCGIIGPSCLRQQHTGVVTTINGEAAPSQLNVHRVPYGSSGSQNNLELNWSGSSSAGGPQIQVYATRVGCVDFNPEVRETDDKAACYILARGGAIEGHRILQLTITHGKGNPERLGSPPEYKLWIVGDPERSATYSISSTWFYGPDC